MQDETDVSISFETVGKRYGATWILRNLTLHVPRTALYVLCDEDGGGKTTALRLIVGLEHADEGGIRVDGFDAWEDRAILRYRLAYMPERFGLYPNLTVDEYLDFFEASYEVPPHQRPQLSDELLELVDLRSRRDFLVDDLEHDEKQWLGLARCLAHDPDVVLLDEPVKNMSPSSQMEMMDMLQELTKLGKTVVIGATHSLDIAEMCTHAGVLRGGELVHQEATGTVIAP